MLVSHLKAGKFGSTQRRGFIIIPAPAAVSRLLGFKAMSAGLRETIERQVQTLKVKGRLREQDGLFRLGIVT